MAAVAEQLHDLPLTKKKKKKENSNERKKNKNRRTEQKKKNLKRGEILFDFNDTTVYHLLIDDISKTEHLIHLLQILCGTRAYTHK